MPASSRPSRLSITWLGHATFLLRSPLGVRLLFDPWLTLNPSCPEDRKKIDALDLMLITHAHSDHCADAMTISRATGAAVVAPFELAVWLEQKGLRNVKAMNVGGSQVLHGVAVTMVTAVHSSAAIEEGRITCLGPAVGYVLRFEDGLTVYFAGDTALFGDMRLIGDMYAPQMAFLPIGDRFTMGPEAAARACEWLRVRQVVPMHYGTFPELTGTPARLRTLVEPLGVQVLALRPGETVE
jgi:L-ascorbate metabolism protein UlaG (beta-lactamase superfamily)